MDLRKMTALEIGALLRKREMSSPEVTKIFLDAATTDLTGAYISLDEDGALRAAANAQERIDTAARDGSEEELSLLTGVPVAVKDNICIEGGVTTAGSKMLRNFAPPYSATVVDRLHRAGAVILGKTNLDEFAMGGSTETSHFGPTKNPWDTSRVPGGSSGGSAAAVAGGLAPYAIGSDTGGSIRQPSAFCGLTGIKPTYGSVSRFGLMAYASSLDQIGPLGLDAKDCAAALSIISGPDEKDSTSNISAPFSFSNILDSQISEEERTKKLKTIKIGVPTNYFKEGIAEDVKKTTLAAIEKMKTFGATIEEFDLPLMDYAVPAYYIIAGAEASSNLSRYDGVKYGYRSKNAQDIRESYFLSRSEGFGTEVKRRIMLGTFVLSSGYFDAYYMKALRVRRLIKEAFDAAVGKYDVVLGPVSPTTAYEIGGQIEDPLAMYMADVYTVSANLTGLPALSMPCGMGENNLPIGIQLIGKAFSEEKLLEIADAWQTATDYHKCRAFESVLLQK
ncbi:MAG: Asp-tRNA(Asn)/Glu-tRNA(Gln) amidotransferase subunit GatA [Clostridiales Family XIII bacterium]|jgi:aspartyl-tRNA(Asn)/glutamyl-tRNA(Gln) amidotransferase subunit A|nr:Asp-tRNA(Asn)/Glu-tRNA(Gln) amidotransferase subunit GatA [Clostridiales Family XIII bacterium]